MLLPLQTRMLQTSATPVGELSLHSISLLLKRAKSGNKDAASAQSAAAVSPCMLPIELLVEIFLYLDTAGVARAAQVCRTWSAASTDMRLWRHLSFERTIINNDPPSCSRSQLRVLFESIS